MLPLENALRDGSHRGVVTPLDGFESPGETFVVLVNLWRPLCFRRRSCVIPATVKGRERSSAILFFFLVTRSVITVPLFNWYPESASISIGIAAVCALLERRIWCRDG